MIVFFLLVILMDAVSAIQIEQLPKSFKVYENSPDGTIIGTIQTYPYNYQMTLIDDANGRFLLDSIGQLMVSVFNLFLS